MFGNLTKLLFLFSLRTPLAAISADFIGPAFRTNSPLPDKSAVYMMRLSAVNIVTIGQDSFFPLANPA